RRGGPRDELVGAWRGGGGGALGTLRPGGAVGDVLGDARREEDRLLEDDGELPAQVGEPVVSEIDLIEEDRPLPGVVEPGEEPHADAGRDIEGDVLEHQTSPSPSVPSPMKHTHRFRVPPPLNADSHLAPASRRQGRGDHLEPIGTAEAPDLYNPVAQLFHGRILATHDPAHAQEGSNPCDAPAVSRPLLQQRYTNRTRSIGRPSSKTVQAWRSAFTGDARPVGRRVRGIYFPLRYRGKALRASLIAC